MTWDSGAIGAACGVAAKVLYDFIWAKKRNGNGASTPFACHSVKVEEKLIDMQDRQKKIWETILLVHDHQLEVKEDLKALQKKEKRQ